MKALEHAYLIVSIVSGSILLILPPNTTDERKTDLDTVGIKPGPAAVMNPRPLGEETTKQQASRSVAQLSPLYNKISNM